MFWLAKSLCWVMYMRLDVFGMLLLCVVNGGTFKCPAAHIVKTWGPMYMCVCCSWEHLFDCCPAGGPRVPFFFSFWYFSFFFRSSKRERKYLFIFVKEKKNLNFLLIFLFIFIFSIFSLFLFSSCLVKTGGMLLPLINRHQNRASA